jgi:hypothetical protein
VVGEEPEHANSYMAAGVVTWRRDDFSGGVDDQCRYLLGKFRPQEVPWVPGGSGPSSSCPYSPECVDVEFLELRLDGVLRSTHPTLYVAPRPTQAAILVLWTEASTMCAGLGRMTSYVSHTDGAERGGAR